MGHSIGGKLIIYVDCVSPYSWFGFTSTLRHRPHLTAHGVTVDIVPFFLGAARDSVGNRYTPTPKWKEKFAKQDAEITGRLLGLKVSKPKIFPILSLFPVRCALYIKEHHPSEKFEASFAALASGYWSKGFDISKPEGILQAFDGIFPPDETKEIMKKALTSENKKRVVDVTMSAGAFGAPWIVAINGETGERKDWFGNDRWDQVFDHLGVPWEPVRVLSPEEAAARQTKL